MKNLIRGLMLVAAIFAGLYAGGCTNEEASRKALVSSGFSAIEFTGYSWGVCSDSDTYATGFTAKNPAKMMVEGTVCCGAFLKGCTVRF